MTWIGDTPSTRGKFESAARQTVAIDRANVADVHGSLSANKVSVVYGTSGSGKTMALLGVLAKLAPALGIYLTPPSVPGGSASTSLQSSDEDRHAAHEQFAKDLVATCASLIVKATQLPEGGVQFTGDTLFVAVDEVGCCPRVSRALIYSQEYVRGDLAKRFGFASVHLAVAGTGSNTSAAPGSMPDWYTAVHLGKVDDVTIKRALDSARVEPCLRNSKSVVALCGNARALSLTIELLQNGLRVSPPFVLLEVARRYASLCGLSKLSDGQRDDVKALLWRVLLAQEPGIGKSQFAQGLPELSAADLELAQCSAGVLVDHAVDRNGTLAIPNGTRYRFEVTPAVALMLLGSFGAASIDATGAGFEVFTAGLLQGALAATAQKACPPDDDSQPAYSLSAEAALKLLQRNPMLSQPSAYVNVDLGGISMGPGLRHRGPWLKQVIQLRHPWEPHATVQGDGKTVRFTYEVDDLLKDLPAGVYVVVNAPGAVWADDILLEVHANGSRRCWLFQCKRLAGCLAPKDWNRAAWLMCVQDPMLARANATDTLVSRAWSLESHTDVAAPVGSSARANATSATAAGSQAESATKKRPRDGFLIAPPTGYSPCQACFVGVHDLLRNRLRKERVGVPEITISTQSDAVQQLWGYFCHSDVTFGTVVATGVVSLGSGQDREASPPLGSSRVEGR
mgnify:FL=1